MSVLCGGTVTPSEVEVGESFSITVESTNDGFLQDEYRYNVFGLGDDGSSEYLGEVDHGTLQPGESDTITKDFDSSGLSAGVTYEIEVQDAVGQDVDAVGMCGDLTVTQSDDGGNGGGGDIVAFQVFTVDGGIDELTAEYTIVNLSSQSYEIDIEISIEGEPVRTDNYVIGGGGNRSNSITANVDGVPSGETEGIEVCVEPVTVSPIGGL